MPGSEFFINEGYGWECVSCRATGGGSASEDDGSASDAARPSDDEDERAQLPRFFREGEAEERGEARLSTRALARRRDTPRGPVLFCPLCGREELDDGR